MIKTEKSIPAVVSAALEKLTNITDRLGTPIDEEIKFVVATLNAFGFVTYSSCAGHNDYGAPYVNIHTQASVDFDSNPEVADLIEKMREFPRNEEYENKYVNLMEPVIKANNSEGTRLFRLIKEFYSDKQPQIETVLVISEFGGGFGGYRLHSHGDFTAEALPENERRKWLAAAQQEMELFAEFLCNKLK